jgi:ParB/RepB/Spo0J family partition protein
MVKARSLSASTSAKLKEVFPDPPAGAAPLEVVKPMTMAELKAGFRKDAVYEIPVSWFDLDDKLFMTRTVISDEIIDSMASSIQDKGQLEPIKARVDLTKDKLQIVMGWTRTFGCQKIGRTVQTMLTDADIRTCKAWALIENVQRNDLTGWDQARKTIELLEEDYTIEEVGQFLGDVSKGHIYNIKNIFKFPLIVEALKSSRVNLSDAIHLAKITSSKEISEDLQSKSILGFEAGTLKRADLDYFIDRKGEVPAAAVATSPAVVPGGKKEKKKKGSTKVERRKAPREEAGTYFQKFSDGKILFNARAVPGKTDVKELKKIRAAVLQFTQALEKIISKAK